MQASAGQGEGPKPASAQGQTTQGGAGQGENPKPTLSTLSVPQPGAPATPAKSINAADVRVMQAEAMKSTSSEFGASKGNVSVLPAPAVQVAAADVQTSQAAVTVPSGNQETPTTLPLSAQARTGVARAVQNNSMQPDAAAPQVRPAAVSAQPAPVMQTAPVGLQNRQVMRPQASQPQAPHPATKLQQLNQAVRPAPSSVHGGATVQGRPTQHRTPIARVQPQGNQATIAARQMAAMQAGAITTRHKLPQGANQVSMLQAPNTAAAHSLHQNLSVGQQRNQTVVRPSSASGVAMMRMNGAPASTTIARGGPTRGGPVVNGRGMHSGHVPMAGVSTPQATPKRSYNSVQRNSGTARAAATPPQKYVRMNSRPVTNTFKNHVHAQDAAAKFKAAYNNAGPALVNIVENAAAYFEGKDTPEAVLDKGKSYERYQFNMHMLTEIFDGPLPNTEAAEPSVDARAASPAGSSLKTKENALKEKTVRADVLRRIGTNILERPHEDRMMEFDAMQTRYDELEERNRNTEKGSMRLFQKLERATTPDEIRKIRNEYERTHDVEFVNAPAPIVKRELDRSLPELRPHSQTRILQFP